jgi:D-methionine transport system substrate-binding protein
MKKFLLAAAIAVAATGLVFAGGNKDNAGSAAGNAATTKKLVTITVGATPEPHADLLNLIKPDMAALGYNLVVKEFTDYVIPNEALESGEIDANYFQHLPYMNAFNKEHGTHLVSVAGIHIEPFAIYSKKITKGPKWQDQVKDGATVAIPNDPTNEGRAFLLLQSAGLLKLKAGLPDNGLEATPLDVADNPKHLKFNEVEAASLPRVLPDVDLATINGNYAIPAGLEASRDGLYVEGADSPYVNVIAVKAGNEKNPAVLALVKCMTSQKVKDYILKKWPTGEVTPVF